MEDLGNTKGRRYWDTRYTCAVCGTSADQIEWCPGGAYHCKPASDDRCEKANSCCALEAPGLWGFISLDRGESENNLEKVSWQLVGRGEAEGEPAQPWFRSCFLFTSWLGG